MQGWHFWALIGVQTFPRYSIFTFHFEMSRMKWKSSKFHNQPLNLQAEKLFWGWHLRFFQVATLKEFQVSRTWFFSDLVETQKKSGFAEQKNLLFETDTDFSNQKSGCRLKFHHVTASCYKRFQLSFFCSKSIPVVVKHRLSK